MQLTPTQEQQVILDSFKEQLDFYQQVYTIQKAYHKHFHWTYSMFKTRFGVWIPDEIKKKKKIVESEYCKAYLSNEFGKQVYIICVGGDWL